MKAVPGNAFVKANVAHGVRDSMSIFESIKNWRREIGWIIDPHPNGHPSNALGDIFVSVAGKIMLRREEQLSKLAYPIFLRFVSLKEMSSRWSAF